MVSVCSESGLEQMAKENLEDKRLTEVQLVMGREISLRICVCVTLQWTAYSSVSS